MWNKKYVVALFAGLAVLAACQKEPFEEETPAPAPEQETWALTLEARKDGRTKALGLDSESGPLTAYWVAGEQAAVYLGGTKLGMLTATPSSTHSTSAILAGALDSVTGVADGSDLTLLFSRAEWNYTGQDGSAPSEAGTMATKYDYALASVTVASLNTSAKTITTTGSADFVNQQSIYRFGFKVSGTPLSVKEFTMSSSQEKLVRSRTYAGGDWTSTYGSLTVVPDGATTDLLYLSLRNENTTVDDTYSFNVLGSDNLLYLGSQNVSSGNLGYGKFVSAKNVSVSKSTVPTSMASATEVW